MITGVNRLRKLTTPIILGALLLVLVACGQQAATTDTSGLATLRLSTDAFGGISTLGVPTSEDGEALVTEVTVRVFDLDGDQLAFTTNNIHDPTGTPGDLRLTPGSSALTIQLPVGRYTFESRGFNSSGAFLAYGRAEHQVVPNASVQLSMDSLLGDSASLRVRPTTPNYVLTNQVLDVMLTLEAPGGAGIVPFDSYDVTYSFSNGSTSTGEQAVDSEWRRGVRARVLSGSFTHFMVTATVSGLVAVGDDVEDGSLTATLSIPIHAIASASGDVTPPHTLTFDAPAALEAGVQVAFSGTADDDIGIGKIQVFEGPILIGSSDENEFGGNVAEISFPDNDSHWSMQYTYTGSEIDFTVVSFDTSGNQRSLTVEPRAASWPGTLQLGGAIYGTAADEHGNIYVVGSNMPASLGGTPVDIKKINAVGEVMWEAPVGTAAAHYARAVTVDPDGNVLVTGVVVGGGSNNDAFLVEKYSSEGALLGRDARRVSVPSSDYRGHGVATDGEGNAYVVGSFYQTSPGGYRMFISKYDTNFGNLWLRTYSSSVANVAMYGYAIATDDAGELYVTGQGTWAGFTNPGWGDAFLIKLDPNGEIYPTWTAQWGTAGNDVGYGIVLDGDHVYVTGALNATVGPNVFNSRAFVAQLDESGVVWMDDSLDTAGQDSGNAITSDGSGNIYVTGQLARAFGGQPFAGGSHDAFLAQYGSSGQNWLQLFGTGSADNGTAVAVDSNGAVVLAGTNPGAFVTKFSADGDLQQE